VKLPVKTLAEFVHRRGDLHARLDGRARAEEGIAVQRALQRDRGGGYQRERTVTLDTELAGAALTISGRIDGCDAGGATILVEEIKTTRADPERAHAHHGAVHWAQVSLYAGLLAREFGDGRGFHLRLIYAHPDTRETRVLERDVDAAAAEAFLDATLAEYATWLAGYFGHVAARDQWLRTLEFPFPRFRPFQRAMARRAYRALRDREHLLLEAPTGSGKTAAMLYPALRALAADGYRRSVFLTSRGTGARAVRDAVNRMDPDATFLRHVTLTAKEKVCLTPGAPCEPDACAYARGYYDRVRPAVVELLGCKALDRVTIEAVARRHTVCPFELSLDAASWCDLVVGDYNYVFDPLVRLQRLAGEPDTAVLVDECHQLNPRARDMLSLELTSAAVKAALAEAPPEALARRVRSLDRALADLRRAHRPTAELPIGRPEALLRSIARFVDALAVAEAPLEAVPHTQALAFACARWARSETWYQPDGFVYTLEPAGGGVEVRLICLDPGPYLAARFAEFGGHVRFSGTVSPLALNARLQGVAEGPAERAGNPFRPEQLGVFVVDDVPTYLRRRAASLSRLVALLGDVIDARTGHYLIAFPSFEYLNAAADAFAQRLPGAVMVRQRPDMDECDRERWLAAFAPGRPPCAGFVVLGGVFGESVDFAAQRLAGIVCVGIGLPPPSASRAALAGHYDKQGLDGRMVAYGLPAMVKVLQMAGRLLRGPDDRGVLCLVDERFAQAGYRAFYPEHWRPQRVRARAVAGRLATFWQATAGPTGL
jgi:DNA excision repair protein ERCC-2